MGVGNVRIIITNVYAPTAPISVMRWWKSQMTVNRLRIEDQVLCNAMGVGNVRIIITNVYAPISVMRWWKSQMTVNRLRIEDPPILVSVVRGRARSVVRGRARSCMRGRSCVVGHAWSVMRGRSCMVVHAWSCMVVRGRARSCVRGRARSVVRGRSCVVVPFCPLRSQHCTVTRTKEGTKERTNEHHIIAPYTPLGWSGSIFFILLR